LSITDHDTIAAYETAIEAARMIESEDQRLKKLVYAYDNATLRDKASVRLEDLCAAADITPDEFLGLIVPALWRRNIDIGKLMHAMAHPQIVEASIQAAKTTWGTLDRQMLHTTSGFLPTKANGPMINIDNRKQTVNANGKVVGVDSGAPGLPSFEQDAIEGAEVLRGDVGKGNVRQIPAPKESQAVQVPGDILEAEFVSSPEN